MCGAAILKYMLAMQDVIDLRERQGWQARRKVEGPKKIEDIHKEARMEQQRARMAPPPDRRDRRDRMPDRPAMPLCGSTHSYDAMTSCNRVCAVTFVPCTALCLVESCLRRSALHAQAATREV